MAAFLVALAGEGWQKGGLMPEEALRRALLAGEEASAGNCMRQGGFGVRSEVSPTI